MDDVNLDNLVKHALVKSSSSYQLVTGHITVTNAVHFSQAPTLGQVNSKNWDKHLNDVIFFKKFKSLTLISVMSYCIICVDT